MSSQPIIDQKQRRFICTCEKSYLSYAALFTHIKQKHGGKPPGPIVRPRSQNKRGRPRKTPNTGQEALSSQDHNNSDQKRYHQIIKLSAINSLHSAPTHASHIGRIFSANSAFSASSGFKKFIPEKEVAKISQIKKQVVKPVRKQISEKMFKGSDSSEAKKLRIVAEGLIGVLKQLQDKSSLDFLKQKIQQIPIRQKFKDYDFAEQVKRFNQEVNCYAVTIGKGVAQFSQFLKIVCSQKQNFEVSTLILLLLQHIQDKQSNMNCLINKNIYQITNYVNNFLEQHLQDQIRKRGIQMIWIFQDNNPIRILLWFFKWLAAKQYSYFKVQMNPEYQKKQSSICQPNASQINEDQISQKNQQELKYQSKYKQQQEQKSNLKDQQSNKQLDAIS